LLDTTMLFGFSHSSTVRGTVPRIVTCSNCNQRFGYELHVRGTGSSFSPWLLGFKEASESAGDEARQDFIRRAASANALTSMPVEDLRSSLNAVPCPHCLHYQPDMIRMLKKRHLIWVAVLGWGLLIFGSLQSYSAVTDPFGSDHTMPPQAIALMVVGATLVALKIVLSARLSPNEQPQDAREALARARTTVLDE